MPAGIATVLSDVATGYKVNGITYRDSVVRCTNQYRVNGSRYLLCRPPYCSLLLRFSADFSHWTNMTIQVLVSMHDMYMYIHDGIQSLVEFHLADQAVRREPTSMAIYFSVTLTLIV